MQVCVMHDIANAAYIRRFFLRQAPEYAMNGDMHVMRYASCGGLTVLQNRWLITLVKQ